MNSDTDSRNRVRDPRVPAFECHVWHIRIDELFEEAMDSDTKQVDGCHDSTRSLSDKTDQWTLHVVPPAPIYSRREDPAEQNRAMEPMTGWSMPREGYQHAPSPVLSSPMYPSREEQAPEQPARTTYSQSPHERGECKPCVFAFRGCCQQGSACYYCHGYHSRRQYKALRLSKPTRERLSSARQMQSRADSSQP